MSAPELNETIRNDGRRSIHLSHPSILGIGPLPPPVAGDALAFQSLLHGLERGGVRVRAVRLPPKKPTEQRTILQLARFVIPVIRFLAYVVQGDAVVYLSIAQSRLGFLRDFCFIWLARMFGRRIVSHLHGGAYDHFLTQLSPTEQRIVCSTLARCDRIVLLSDKFRQQFDLVPGIGSRLRIVSNGVPPPLPSANKSLPPYPQPIQILYLSNMVQSKGYLEVLEAMAILKREGVAAQCDFAGAFCVASDDSVAMDPQMAHQCFRRRIGDLGLDGEVRYHGVVRGASKLSLLRRAHIFVLPTHYVNEGQPISIIEAMAAGLVVISTDYRAIPDLVVDGVTGFLVPPQTSEEIANAVMCLVNDPDRYQRMSKEGRARYARLFTYDRYVEGMLNVFCEVAL